ncbi:MAG: hypothetical protein M1833_006974 [Piccolia ochrophora]|nr:MAG: hypothetical protein M1833_006974 [Piccolia ochrophora]
MTTPTPDDKAAIEAKIPSFTFTRILNHDRAGLRTVLLGSIHARPAILILERAAFPTSAAALSTLSAQLTQIHNLGHNDIYAWYLASSPPGADTPDLKLNLIHPATDAHVTKYTPQGARVVTEPKEVYADHVRPFMLKKREEGRLNWVWNILEGRTEVEDVILRDEGGEKPDEGFLLLPDLNWDRKTLSSLHLLLLPLRRDIWSLRDLRRAHVPWLRHMRAKLLAATVKLYPDLERDMLKLYVHYQPTYYHFHIHVVHVALEAGATQAVGKAFGLENVIGQLETMQGGDGVGMADVELTYTLGEASELWTNVFKPLKEGTLENERLVEGLHEAS